MNPEDAKKCAKYLAGLFPNQLTQEQFRYAAGEFKAFDVPDVTKAIKEHRATGATKEGFIDWKNLLASCRNAVKSRAVGETVAHREGSWCDVYRRQRPDLAQATDLEVVLRIHRGWWSKAGGFGGDKERRPSDGTRRQIEHSCLSQLIVSGTKPGDAPGWAATIFEDSVDYFRQVLEEVRQAAAAPGQEALPV